MKIRKARTENCRSVTAGEKLHQQVCPRHTKRLTEHYLPRPDRRPSTHCTDGLIGLSVRWTQPIQQQGRRFPSRSSATVRVMWFFLVSGCLTLIFQQIHSLRASGVRLCQAVRAAGEAANAFCRSAGSLCAVPPARGSEAMHVLYLMPAGVVRLWRATAPLSPRSRLPVSRQTRPGC